MQIEANRFKQAIALGQRQIGIWSSLCSRVATEIIADAGFDWILFDAEHSPVEIAGLYDLLQAAGRSRASLAVRLASNDKVMIKRALDIGAQTLLIPFIQNADEARAAVRACRYPPDGVRGVAGSTRASRYGRDKGYFKSAGDNICLIAQVETGEALGNLEAIAKTDGVDAVFIGPSDLAASMGHIGNPGHADVQGAIRDALTRLTALGVPAGILAVTAQDARRYGDWGFTFVAAGVDTVLLARAADQLVAEVQQGDHGQA
jgi:4-hydroxy-2-oxoheptanedioate aldolase